MYATWISYKRAWKDEDTVDILKYKLPSWSNSVPSEVFINYTNLSSPLKQGDLRRLVGYNLNGIYRVEGNYAGYGYGARPALYH